MFELRDLKIKMGQGRTGGTKVPRASMGLSRPRNTTCVLCSKQGGKRCKKVAERWAGPAHTGPWKPWGQGWHRFHSECNRMGNYHRGLSRGGW